MTAPIDFFVPGTPAPQPRPRGQLIRGPKPFIKIYTPNDAKDWKEAVARYALASFRITPLDEPLRLCLSFRMQRPQSHSLKNGLRLNAPVFHLSTPDLDNLEKAVMDALTGILWRDDSIICQKYAEKVYVSPGQDTGVRILVTRPVTDFIPDPTLLEASCS